MRPWSGKMAAAHLGHQGWSHISHPQPATLQFLTPPTAGPTSLDHDPHPTLPHSAHRWPHISQPLSQSHQQAGAPRPPHRWSHISCVICSFLVANSSTCRGKAGQGAGPQRSAACCDRAGAGAARSTRPADGLASGEGCCVSAATVVHGPGVGHKAAFEGGGCSLRSSLVPPYQL